MKEEQIDARAETDMAKQVCGHTKHNELSALNSKLFSELQAARNRENELGARNAELKESLDRSNKRAVDLDSHREFFFQSIKQLEEQQVAVASNNSRLAMVNAGASESIAPLEDPVSPLVSMSDSLARANAIGAELMCDVEAQAVELREALERVRVLQGIISICMHCQKIRQDGDVWNRLEEYKVKHPDVRFSHGLCPTCLEAHYPRP